MTDGDPATTFNLRDAGKGLERYPRNVSSRVLFDLGTRFPINYEVIVPEIKKTAHSGNAFSNFPVRPEPER